ncbi:MAG TPA: tape measure protein [Pyrinomonadaceae bacterium]|nr:tape measure protein [Pyrinomonadaceae bacterium]
MGYNYKLGVVVSQSGARGAASELDRLDSKLTGIGKAMSGAMASFTGNLAADAVQRFASAAVSGAQAVFEYSENLKSTQIGLESIIGSATNASVLFQQIETFARSTPFNALDLTGLAQRFAGAKVQLSQIVPLLRDLGNVTAATGKASQERLEGLGTALTQVIAKQKLSAEEAEQFAERGVNAYDLVAQATGRTQAQVRKLAEDGKISASDFIAAFQRVSRERWGDAMAKQSQLASVALEKIKTALLDSAATALKPWMDEFGQLSGRLRDDLTKQKRSFEESGRLVARYLGEGFGKAIHEIAAYLGKEFGKALRGEAEKNIIDEFEEGFDQGFWQPIIDSLERRGIYALFGRRGNMLNPQTYGTTGTAPRTYDYTRPDFSKTTPSSQNPAAAVQQDLDEIRKKREEFLKKQRADLARYNQLQIADAQQVLQNFQSSAEGLYESGQLNLQSYIAQSAQSLEGYAATVRALMEEGYKVSTAGKSGQELANETLEYTNALKKLDADIQAEMKRLYQVQKDAENKRSESEISAAEQKAQRLNEVARRSMDVRLAQLALDLDRGLVDEMAYEEAIARLRLSAIEDEKARATEAMRLLDKKSDKYAEYVQTIKLLDLDLALQQIENARKLEEAKAGLTTAGGIGRAPGDPGEEGESSSTAPPPDPFAQWKESWEEFKASIENSVGITNVLTGIGTAIIDLGQRMAEATGRAVEGWALYGDSIGLALKKALAAELAHVAGVATVNALYATALGFMRLAQWDFVGAGQAFTSAALWAALAGGTALAAKAVAGDSFRQSGSTASNQSSPDYYTATSPSIQTTSVNRVQSETNNRVAAAIERLEGKIGSMSAGEVLTVGAKEKRGFIAEQVTRSLKSNGTAATDMGRALRLA